MQKLVSLLVLVGLFSFSLMAQDNPKVEVFGGYQYLRLGGDFGGINANGWNASLTGNFNKYLGVAGDFSGAYKNSAHLYSYTVGPVVSLNSGGKVNPFVHALFGGAPLGGGGASENGFTMMFGGGADAKLSKAIAVRVIQADWVSYRFSGVNFNKNVRISTGIVFRF